ncbi:MAG: hypothetical protein HY216_08500 [Candidatus Rokubacteria bacterium]|nr:hypothetical protein [Candidatus Rokubacteria bacterium]
MDTRHFELQDLLSDALIALEAGNHAAAAAAVRRALAWVETDWLKTPSDIRATAAPPAVIDEDDDD